jgi:hypothetical protein
MSNEQRQTGANIRSPSAQRSRIVQGHEDLKALLEKVAANPAKVEWPTDPWGFTSPIRRVGLEVCGRVNGQEDKQRLLVATLAILLQHAQTRYERDLADKALKRGHVEQSQSGRLNRQRQFGKVISAADKAALDKADAIDKHASTAALPLA